MSESRTTAATASKELATEVRNCNVNGYWKPVPFAECKINKNIVRSISFFFGGVLSVFVHVVRILQGYAPHLPLVYCAGFDAESTSKNPKGVKLKHSIKIKMKKKSDGRQRRARCARRWEAGGCGRLKGIQAKANGWNITLTCTVFNFRSVSFHHWTLLLKPYTIFVAIVAPSSPLAPEMYVRSLRFFFVFSSRILFVIPFRRLASTLCASANILCRRCDSVN